MSRRAPAIAFFVSVVSAGLVASGMIATLLASAIVATLLASASAHAASLPTMPTIRTAPHISMSDAVTSVPQVTPIVPITTASPPCHGYGYGYGCGGPPPPAYPQYPRFTSGPTNDQFDTTGNLNPGGGGGGTKPGKKPNLD